jgi:oxygen-dependent protoporphyrinogen oxidase
VSVRPDSRSRFVFRKGRLRRFPLAPHQAAAAFLRAYLVLADPRADREKLTLEEWGTRHLGRAAVERLLNPFVRGIYAARPSEISVGAAFPDLLVPPGHSLLSWLLARNVTRRAKYAKINSKNIKKPMMAPLYGVGDLVGRLEARLTERLGERFVRGRAVEALPAEDSGVNRVLCVPAYEAARLLQVESPELSLALSQIRYAPMVSVTAFVPLDAVPERVRGVGVLVPEAEAKRRALGILFNSSSFEGRVVDPEAHASFTVMLGGTSDPTVIDVDDNQLRSLVDQELRQVLGLKDSPVAVEIHRWPRAIPVYDAAVAATIRSADETWCSRPGRALFGNYTGQVSLRGMVETASRLA